MKRLIVLMAVVSIVAVAALAYGDMGDHDMAPGMMGGRGMGCGMMGGSGMDGSMRGAGHHMWMHLRGLNLDEQQKAAIGEIRSRVMKDAIRKMADMRIIRLELWDLLGKDPVDMRAVEAKVKQSEALRTEMHLAHIRAMEEVKAKLTPDQRKKFRTMIEDGPMAAGMGVMHHQECCMTRR